MMRWPWSKKQQASRQPNLMEGQDDYVFRRSRTLTGTTSAQVAASAEERGRLKTQRLKLHQLRQYRLQLVRAVAAGAVFIGIIVYITTIFISTPSVNFLQKGKQKPNTAEYQATISAYLGDRPLERLGLLLNSQQLEVHLKQKHPEIRAVQMQKAWYGGDVKFTLYFREPLLVWRTGEKRFFVDDQGVAFAYNHFVQPKVVVTDESGLSPDVGGGAVASSRFVSFLGRMVGAVNDYKKGRVVNVILPASTRQIDLKLEGRDYPIKTHIDRDPLQQAEDIANALTFFDSKGIKPTYVDVRVAHKAYYK